MARAASTRKPDDSFNIARWTALWSTAIEKRPDLLPSFPAVCALPAGKRCGGCKCINFRRVPAREPGDSDYWICATCHPAPRVPA